MAFVYEESFRLSDGMRRDKPNLAKDLDGLYKNVNDALRWLSGPPIITTEGPLYPKPPKGLSAKIWGDTIISYDIDQAGATAKYPDLEIVLGDTFAQPRPRLLIEKVILHEFLHLVLFSQRVPKPFHHGRIDEIIEGMLPGNPNPLGEVGSNCGN